VNPGRATPRRTVGAAVVCAALLVLVGCGGGGGGGSSDQGYVPPKGPATETIQITAQNFSFTPDNLTAKAGIAEIQLTSKGGIHTFVFDGAYSGFFLEVEGNGDTQSQKIDLKPGKYTFYCNVANHRALGMEGTLTVTG
jgi:plastocyanin